MLLDAAASARVPALDLFERLEANADWAAGIEGGDGVYPTARGYAAQMAHAISAWPAWQALFTES
ncbi:MAG: hypothetical protein EXQ99_06985 [Alphaproteobacteria bacterium]|nr:hypothetical protein [Alphaproteobacteria bacterium]